MEPTKTSHGRLIALVVVLVIVLIIGFIVWTNKKSTAPVNPEPQAQAVTAQDAAQLDALNGDLQKMDTDVSTDANGVN